MIDLSGLSVARSKAVVNNFRKTFRWFRDLAALIIEAEGHGATETCMILPGMHEPGDRT
jgi:hypothetical protein